MNRFCFLSLCSYRSQEYFVWPFIVAVEIINLVPGLFIEKGKIIYWKRKDNLLIRAKDFFFKGRKNDTKRYNISYRTFPYLQLTLMTRAQCTNSYFSYCYSFDFWIFMQFCLPHAIFVCNSFVTFLQQMQWWVWTRLHIYGSIKWTSFM